MSPFFGPFSIIYEMNTENSSVWVILMMAWPENIFFGGGGSKKRENFLSHFWVLFDVDFAMRAKKRGVRIPVWRYGPCKNSVQEGWKLYFAVFSVFLFSAQGAPTPTTDHVLVQNQPQI